MIPIAKTFGTSRGASILSTRAIVSARRAAGIGKARAVLSSAREEALLAREDSASALLWARAGVGVVDGVRGGVIATVEAPLRLAVAPRPIGATAVWKGSSLSMTSCARKGRSSG